MSSKNFKKPNNFINTAEINSIISSSMSHLTMHDIVINHELNDKIINYIQVDYDENIFVDNGDNLLLNVLNNSNEINTTINVIITSFYQLSELAIYFPFFNATSNTNLYNDNYDPYIFDKGALFDETCKNPDNPTDKKLKYFPLDFKITHLDDDKLNKKFIYKAEFDLFTDTPINQAFDIILKKVKILYTIFDGETIPQPRIEHEVKEGFTTQTFQDLINQGENGLPVIIPNGVEFTMNQTQVDGEYVEDEININYNLRVIGDGLVVIKLLGADESDEGFFNITTNVSSITFENFTFEGIKNDPFETDPIPYKDIFKIYSNIDDGPIIYFENCNFYNYNGRILNLINLKDACYFGKTVINNCTFVNCKGLPTLIDLTGGIINE
jgi:hypothetical protein